MVFIRGVEIGEWQWEGKKRSRVWRKPKERQGAKCAKTREGKAAEQQEKGRCITKHLRSGAVSAIRAKKRRSRLEKEDEGGEGAGGEAGREEERKESQEDEVLARI